MMHNSEFKESFRGHVTSKLNEFVHKKAESADGEDVFKMHDIKDMCPVPYENKEYKVWAVTLQLTNDALNYHTPLIKEVIGVEPETGRTKPDLILMRKA